MSIEVGSLIFKEIQVQDFERVVEVVDESAGLRAIIAIHDTRLGPALGGTRVFPYATFDDALTDVLRLARGMTYKASMVQMGTGGGKSVIFADGRFPKSKKLLLAFAEAVNFFGGDYICAEDVGMMPEDLQIVRQGTRYVVGIPHPKSSGDPSRFTAWGVFRGVQAVCQHLWKSDSVRGKTIAIQGLGAVGMKLAQYLFWGGAQLIVSDIDPEKAELAAKELGAKVVSPREIHRVACDIFSPCAMGAMLNPQTISELRCSAVAGAANNQLLTDADGETLRAKNILYAPDYLINAGGLVNVCFEIDEQGYNPASSRDHLEHIYHRLLEVFAQADKKGKSTRKVADEIAESHLERGIGKRTVPVVFHH